MNNYNFLKNQTVIIGLIFILSIGNGVMVMGQQRTVIGIHADPTIGWFSSDIKRVSNEGARPGFNFGLTVNRYFTPNYSFSTGISLINAGGRLISTDTTRMEFSKNISTVLPGEAIIYKIKYLSIPLGIKLQTNQIGYVTFFSDIGIDPKIVIGSKADIPSLDLSGESAFNEINRVNLAYHFTAGIEYSVGGTTAFVLGLGFENNFLDITHENNLQPNDKILHKLLNFRLGVIF